MRCGAIDQCSIESRCAPAFTKNQTWSGTGANGTGGDLSGGFAVPGKRYTDSVENPHLGPVHRVRGQSFMAQRIDPFRNFQS